MNRRRQPAMHMGERGTRPWADEAHDEIDDNGGEVWHQPTALRRGWAFTRLVGLVLACGLGAGIAVGVALWITLTALDSSL
jgi:hypothetical protein